MPNSERHRRSGRKTKKKSISTQPGADSEGLQRSAARGVVRSPTAPFMLPKSIRLKGKGKLASQMVLEDQR